MKNDFLKGIEYLREDKYLGKIVSKMDIPILNYEENFFLSLIKYVIYQQLSIKAAHAIYTRFICLFKNNRITPINFKNISYNSLLRIGISRSKIIYMNNIAEVFINDQNFLSEVQNTSNQEIVSKLINIKGIGPWTADMFLMFTLQRLDIFPIKDLGIKKGMQKLFNLKSIPSDAFMIKRSNRWSPYRTIVCLYLWKLIDGNDFEW